MNVSGPNFDKIEIKDNHMEIPARLANGDCIIVCIKLTKVDGNTFTKTDFPIGTIKTIQAAANEILNNFSDMFNSKITLQQGHVFISSNNGTSQVQSGSELENKLIKEVQTIKEYIAHGTAVYSVAVSMRHDPRNQLRQPTDYNNSV